MIVVMMVVVVVTGGGNGSVNSYGEVYKLTVYTLI